MKSHKQFLPVFLVSILTTLTFEGVFGVGKLSAATLYPSIRTSIEDKPVDGFGDSLHFEEYGEWRVLKRVIAHQPEWNTVERRVILEYDVSSFAGQVLEEATLNFSICANNFIDPKVRAFDIFLYSGNGIAELDDFSVEDYFVDTVAYTVPETASFSIDIILEAQYIWDDGGSFLGIKVVPLGSHNPTSVICDNPFLTIEAVPEPSTLLLLGLGCLALRRCSGPALRRKRRAIRV